MYLLKDRLSLEKIFTFKYPCGLPGGTSGDNPRIKAADARCAGSIPGWGDPLEKAWQPTPVFLPGESPWTEEPGGLQSIGSQGVGHD